MKITNRETALQLIQKSRKDLVMEEFLANEKIIEVFSKTYEELKSEKKYLEELKVLIDPSSFDFQNVNAIIDFLNPSEWRKKMSVELPAMSDTLTDAYLSYQPLGILLHICPGNSFLGGLDSLLHGLVAGNLNIARVSQNTAPILPKILEMLQANGLPQHQAVIVEWKSGTQEIEDVFKKNVDAIVVWGGEQVIQTYQTGLAPGVRLIEYGPKLSFSILTEKTLKQAEQGSQSALEKIDGIVSDICRFEQASCSSTQHLLIQSAGHSADRANAMKILTDAMNRYCAVNPPVEKSKHEQIEMLKFLERAKLQKIQGRADFTSGYPDWCLHWADSDFHLSPSSLFRTLNVSSFQGEEDLKKLVSPVRHYLQTTSLGCEASEWEKLRDLLWKLGVNRVVQSGQSTTSTTGAPHDGGFLLSRFSRIVSAESKERRKHLWMSANKSETLRKIQEIMEVSKSSPLYLNRFQKMDLKNITWDQFESIPWLLREDLNEKGPPFSNELLTVPYENLMNAYLFTTGGSTGKPKYGVYSKKEWDQITDIFCREYEALGLSSSDRVANLFNSGGLWSAFIAVTESLEKLGCLNLPIGANIEPTQSLELMKSVKCTALFGLPSTILRLAHAASENQYEIKISKILFGGEHLNEPAKEYIKKVFNADIVMSGSYAAVDAGCIGYQCVHARGSLQHILENYAYVEICSEETGRPVQSGEIGEVIVTNLSRKLFPIIRLRTGDRARQHCEKCACGTDAMTIELLGRSDDMVRIGGANVFVSDVEKLVQKFSSTLSSFFQLRASKVGVDDSYELVLETASDTELSSSQKEKIELEYLKIAEELEYYLDKKFLKHFKISYLKPQSIVANSRTGKIPKVIDSRK